MSDIDPMKGETWEAHDGGSFYILKRTPKIVTVSRRPPNDSLCECLSMRLSTFRKQVVFRSRSIKYAKSK